MIKINFFRAVAPMRLSKIIPQECNTGIKPMLFRTVCQISSGLLQPFFFYSLTGRHLTAILPDVKWRCGRVWSSLAKNSLFTWIILKTSKWSSGLIEQQIPIYPMIYILTFVFIILVRFRYLTVCPITSSRQCTTRLKNVVAIPVCPIPQNSRQCLVMLIQ